jgi:hypothetical protein
VADERRARLDRAWARLEPLGLYPRPVPVERVRVLIVPWLFRLARMRRYGGYALWRTILLRRPLAETSDDLLTHELCHVWQAQNRPLHVFLKWLTTSYRENPYEVEARRAVTDTRAA